MPSVAELKIVYQRNKKRTTDKFAKTSEAAYQILRNKLQLADREQMWVLHLTARNKVIACELVSMGCISECMSTPRQILKAAVIRNSSSIIIGHNHPSGKAEPSQEDKVITKKIIEAAQTLEIALLDHIIIGEDSYFSFADNGLI